MPPAMAMIPETKQRIANGMKSAMGTYVTAVEAIQKAGLKLGGDVVIAGVAGEIEKAPVNDHEGPMYQGYGVGTKYAITHGAIFFYVNLTTVPWSRAFSVGCRNSADARIISCR